MRHPSAQQRGGDVCISVRVPAQLADVLSAIACLENERPDEIVNDVVVSWVRTAADDPVVRATMSALRRRRLGLRAVR